MGQKNYMIAHVIAQPRTILQKHQGQQHAEIKEASKGTAFCLWMLTPASRVGFLFGPVDIKSFPHRLQKMGK